MLGIDTSVVVRYLTNDDKRQAARARELVDGNDVFVPLTVLLESEWVLRSVYRVPPRRVVQALRDFAGLPRVTLENAPAAARALNWCEQGMDFADALHLVTADRWREFVTFDAAFAKSATRITGLTVRAP